MTATVAVLRAGARRAATALALVRLAAMASTRVRPERLGGWLHANRWVVVVLGVGGSDATAAAWAAAVLVLRRLGRRGGAVAAAVDAAFDVLQLCACAVAAKRAHARASNEARAFAARAHAATPPPARLPAASFAAFASALFTGGLLLPHSVEHVKNVTYAEPSEIEHAGGSSVLPYLQLDILRRKTGYESRPVLIYVHGGAWLAGDKRLPTLPICYHFASAANWVVLNINYRLAPASRLADMLIDIKRAIRWARQNAHVHGGNPDFIAISGGSAGGHLCSLAALTANWKLLQPGFEDVDTGVQACLPFYPAVGHVWSNALWKRWFVESVVGMTEKESIIRMGGLGIDDWCDPMSILTRLIPVEERAKKIPPFFIVHGTHDNVVDPVLVRKFFTELSRENTIPVGYLEIPNAYHAFDIAIGPTVMNVLWACESAMDSVYRAWLDTRDPAFGVLPAA